MENLPQTQKTNEIALLKNWEISLIKSWRDCSSVKSFTEVLKSESPKICELVKIHSETIVNAILTKKIQGLVDFFNVGKNMSATQIVETISLILENFPNFKPEDIELCFKQAKSGQFGQVYDRLDGQVILGWIFAYKADKEVFVEHNNFMLHKEIKKEAERSSPEVLAKGIELLKKNYVEPLKAEKKKISYEKCNPKNYNKEQLWLIEFDKIAYDKCETISGVRFIEIDGQKLSQQEFLKYKSTPQN